jgi:light-regulated signal transduction histidine kinase (bacteriophytochrome)
MGELISSLLRLSHASRADLTHEPVDVSTVARDVIEELQRCDPDRPVTVTVEDNMVAGADPALLRVVLQNLIGNAWKYTTRTSPAGVHIGTRHLGGPIVFVVWDNGAGFDMDHAENLFRPYGRLHSERDFPGTGIGLATVRRITTGTAAGSGRKPGPARARASISPPGRPTIARERHRRPWARHPARR